MTERDTKERKKPGPEPERFKLDEAEIDEALENLVSDRPKPKKRERDDE